MPSGTLLTLNCALQTIPFFSQGQMMYINETDLIMFQCYPSVMNLDDLTK